MCHGWTIMAPPRTLPARSADRHSWKVSSFVHVKELLVAAALALLPVVALPAPALAAPARDVVPPGTELAVGAPVTSANGQ